MVLAIVMAVAALVEVSTQVSRAPASAVEDYRSFPLGVIRSGGEHSKWEPQVIYAYENPEDRHRVIFEFCHSSTKGHCFFIGPDEGVLKDVLDEEREMAKWLEGKASAIGLLTPLASSIVSFFAAAKLFKTMGTFFVGGVSAGSFQYFEKAKWANEYWSDISIIFSGNGFAIKLSSKISLVEFAQALQSILGRASWSCREDKDSPECAEWKKQANEAAEELNQKFKMRFSDPLR